MRYEREDMIELAKLPFNIAKAVARGVGRIIVQHLEDFMYQDNPYINMTEAERRQIEEQDRGVYDQDAGYDTL